MTTLDYVWERMGFFDDKQSYLTQEEIDYCQRLNETLDAHRASAELERKVACSKQRNLFSKWNQRKHNSESEKKE